MKTNNYFSLKRGGILAILLISLLFTTFFLNSEAPISLKSDFDDENDNGSEKIKFNKMSNIKNYEQ